MGRLLRRSAHFCTPVSELKNALAPIHEISYPQHDCRPRANDYLELLADTGVVGGLCGLCFIVLVFWRGLANVQAAEGRFPRAIFAGSLVVCAGLLLHSLVDFNLHIPANALIFLLLAAVATAPKPEATLGHSARRLQSL